MNAKRVYHIMCQSALLPESISALSIETGRMPKKWV